MRSGFEHKRGTPVSKQQKLEDDTKRTLYVTVAQDTDFHGETLSVIDTSSSDEGNQSRDTYLLTLESEHDLAEVFSQKSLELLRTIRQHSPASMRETARIVDRDIKAVSRSLNRLEEMGVVEFEQQGRAKRPIITFDKVNVTVDLDQNDPDIDPTSAQLQDVTAAGEQDTASQSTTTSSVSETTSSSNRELTPKPLKSSDPSEMPEGHFTEVEFPAGLSGDGFFNNVHDPHLVYDFVRLLHDRLEHEFTRSASINFNSSSNDRIGSEERRTNAEIYTKVEILRGTMQYVEEFGIYLAAYLCDDRPLASSLIDTKVSHFYDVFENTDRTVGQYLAERGVDSDYDDRLRAVFGYRELLNLFSQDGNSNRRTGITPIQTHDSNESQSTDEDSGSSKQNSELGSASDAEQALTRDEVEVAIDASLEVLRSRIETIAQFYLEFRDLYNAVKHGTRLIPQDGFEIETELTEESISIDEQYVGALCKTSGDRDGGRPYFLHYPADRLVSRSLYVLEQTHGLFEYLRRLHRDTGENETHDQGTTVRFFALKSRVEDDDTLQRVLKAKTSSSSHLDSDASDVPGAQTALESGEYIQIGNADFKAFIPRSESFGEPSLSAFAARLSLRGGTVVIETEFHEEPSEQYPMMMTYHPKYGTGARLSLMHKLSMNADLTQLDFTQYHQLLEIEEAEEKDALEYVEIDVLDGGDSITEPFASGEWSMNVPETSFGRDLTAFLARLELITQRRIPIPASVFDEQLSILRSERDSVDKRVDAQSVLNRLEASGSGAVYTHVSVKQDGELHHLTSIPGTLTPTVTLPSGETRSIEEVLDGDRGSFSLRFEGFPGTPKWFVGYLRDNPDTVEGIFEGSVPGDEDSHEQFAVVIEFDLHVQTFWYDESQVTIRAESMDPRELDTKEGKSQ